MVACCSPTNATRATSQFCNHSAPSGPRTARSSRTSSAASSVRAAASRRVDPSAAVTGGVAPARPHTASAAPRTPWGDPDLQGVWSSDDTSGVPMSRPVNLGNNLYQSHEQWAARQKQTEQGIQNALNAIGTFRGDYARRSFRQTSLIVDPPDGRTPAFTP